MSRYTPIGQVDPTLGPTIWAVYTSYPFSTNHPSQRSELEAAMRPLVPPNQHWHHLNPFAEPAVSDADAARAAWLAHRGYAEEYFLGRRGGGVERMSIAGGWCIFVTRGRITLLSVEEQGDVGFELARDYGVVPKDRGLEQRGEMQGGREQMLVAGNWSDGPR